MLIMLHVNFMQAMHVYAKEVCHVGHFFPPEDDCFIRLPVCACGLIIPSNSRHVVLVVNSVVML